MALFRRVAAEHRPTILMITHNPECASFADAVVEMQDGRVLAHRAARARAEEGRR
jgi:ABC-type lipoprotein export system ATPase subunit